MRIALTSLALLAAAAALSVAPATAQQAGPPGSSDSGPTMVVPGIDLGGGGERQYTPEQKEKFEQIDSDYKRTMQKVPDKKVSSDPWANMRQSPSR